MQIIIFIILGLCIIAALTLGLLQLWFWILRKRELKKDGELIEDLTNRNIPKLSKEEQCNFLDGNWDWTKIQSLLGKKEIPVSVLDYFIDISPDEYLKHLQNNNPPSRWQEDADVETQIEQLESEFQLTYYFRGSKSSIKVFSNYDQLLRYLVYERLTNAANKYKQIIDKSYYA